MGLHLNFQLRLSPTTPRTEVAEKRHRRRAFARQMAGRRVSEFYTADRPWRTDDGEVDQFDGYVRLWISLFTDPPADHPDALVEWDESSAMGSVVDPGEGSETAP